MGLLGTIAKIVGGAALEKFIAVACQQLEQFVKGAKANFNHTWTYDFVFKGRRLGSIDLNVRKSRSNVTFKISGLKAFRFPLTGISEACVVAVHAALALV